MSDEHEHYWSYVHAVYGGDRGGVHVRRFCKCGREEVGLVGRWREPKPDEFDIVMEGCVPAKDAP